MPLSASRKLSPMTRSVSSGRSLPSLAVKAQLELAKMKAATAEKTMRVVKPYTPHPPSPKQRLALELSHVEEMLCGGAAGGGKSDGLLEMALQFVDVGGYQAGIFRKTEVDLKKPDSILDRAHSWFAGTPAHWDGGASAFRFPSGATIHFGYGQSKAELEQRYQGPAFQFIGIEEAGQWTEEAYRFMFSRLRRLTGTPVPLRMRATCNPGGVGAEWIRRRFIDFAKMLGNESYTVKELIAAKKRGEALPERPIFVSPASSDIVQLCKELGREPQGAYFIPWFAQDNPGLDQVEYRLQLAKLDSTTRAQLEHGDWWATRGKLFRVEFFRYLDFAPPKLFPYLRAWDLAATEPRKGKDPDWSAGVKMGLEHLQNGKEREAPKDEFAPMRIVVAHSTRTRQEPGGTEAFVRGVAEADGKRVPVYIEEEPGSAGKNNTHNYASKVLPGWRVEGVRKTGSKLEYWKPLSADAENGLLYLVRGDWNAEFVEEFCSLTEDDSHAHDDMADATATGRSLLFESQGLRRLRLWAS